MDKKHKLIISIMLVLTIIVVVSAILYVADSNSLKKYSSEEISFNYDSNWNISKHDDNIYLVDSSGSSVTITVTKLDNDTIGMSLDDINSSIISKLMSDNTSYKRIAEQKTKITNIYYDGYKTLLEDKNNQALVFVCSTSDYVLTVNYSAENKYFDMSLDSVENIVGSIAI